MDREESSLKEHSNLVESQLAESSWEDDEYNSAEPMVSTEPVEGGSSLRSGTSEAFVPEVNLQKQPKVWAIAGGKGGVGKSLICANFSIMLSRMGHKVLAVDLDLGGSNLHTCLGVDAGKNSIGDYMSSRVTDLRQLCMHTREKNLHLITGSADPINVIRRTESKETDLLRDLRKLPYDDIVIDLGAGTQESTVEFFLGADEGVLSILPEPTSVENAYRFIRTIFLSKLSQADVSESIKDVIEASFDQKNFLGIRTPADLMAVVERLDPVALSVLQKVVEDYHPNIIVNQVRSQADIDVGKAICSVCRRYFGLSLNYVGYLEYDNSVWRAVRSKNSVVHEFPTSILTSRFDRITRTLVGEMKGLFP